MKYFAVLFTFLLFPTAVFAAEEINSFTSDITLGTNGTFDVTETIVYDFDTEERHGIFRYIEKKHPQAASSFLKERYIDIEVEKVAIDGGEVPYDITDSSNQVEIKIGNPDVTITGLHTYVIEYKVLGGYSFFDDGTAEIYWNVTGNGWEVPIQSAIARVYGSNGVLLDTKACYVGQSGVNTSCENISILENGSTEFTATALSSNDGLTIAQSIDGTKIEQVILEKVNSVLIFLGFLPLLIVGLIIFGYRYRTKYRTHSPIIAQYEPYKDFKPMYAGLLFDGSLDPRDITAGIVYLAEQGFIKIQKTEKKVLFIIEVDDYIIELQKPLEQVESIFLRDVLELLFLTTASVGSTVSLSDLKTDTSKQRENALRLQRLRTDLKKDMNKKGFLETKISGWYIVTAVAVFFGSLFLVEVLSPSIIVLWFVFLTVSIVVLLILYERRTRVGYEALDYLKGFKLFLSVTDTERFKFHNAPQKSPEQFMEYLPYAIAFGVEKQWAKTFEGITIPSPGWYDGGNVGTFSAVSLSSSLGGFSSSFVASSGSSGSSGGGSSGGGGGGGGGGSW